MLLAVALAPELGQLAPPPWPQPGLGTRCVPWHQYVVRKAVVAKSSASRFKATARSARPRRLVFMPPAPPAAPREVGSGARVSARPGAQVPAVGDGVRGAGPWPTAGTRGDEDAGRLGPQSGADQRARSPERECASASSRGRLAAARRRDARPSVGRHLQAAGDTVQRPPARGEGARHAGRGRGTDPRGSGEGQVRDPRQDAPKGASLKAGEDLSPRPTQPCQLSDKAASVGL